MPRSPAVCAVAPAILALDGALVVFMIGGDKRRASMAAFIILVVSAKLIVGATLGGASRHRHDEIPSGAEALDRMVEREFAVRLHRKGPGRTPDRSRRRATRRRGELYSVRRGHIHTCDPRERGNSKGTSAAAVLDSRVRGMTEVAILTVLRDKLGGTKSRQILPSDRAHNKQIKNVLIRVRRPSLSPRPPNFFPPFPSRRKLSSPQLLEITHSREIAAPHLGRAT